jgi:hypothetical protein
MIRTPSMLVRTFAALALASSAAAADLPSSSSVEASAGAYAAAAACPVWQPRYGISYVPTNAPCDPTYVGSSMGLSRPSYYGALPGPGYDAP